ncbi:MAG: beta strand repeat-containing protein, partial [Acidimicrobiales bacterium]
MIEITARSGAAAVDSLINMGGVVEARSVGMENGTVVFYGASDGVVQLTGKVDVSGRTAGETGGTIKVLGGKVALAGNASLDASGDAGGGTILVGGDFQGKGETPTAQRTYVGRDVTINADAITTGNADKVIVWADGDTRYYGSISARGGAQSGDGGLVEVSGKQNLGFDGKVDTSAPNGTGGSLLLDPEFIVIENSPFPTSPPSADDGEISGDGTIFFSDPDGPLGLTFFISENALEGLSTATITLQATNSITINNLDDDELTLNQSGLVTFEAGAGGFIMNDPDDFIHFTGGGSLTIDTTKGTGSGAIALGKVGLGSGDLKLTGTTVTLNNTVSTTSGRIDITAADVEILGTLNATSTGIVTITNTSGTLQVGNNLGDDMNISGAELGKITAGTLTLTSPATITVDGVLDTDSAGIGNLLVQTGISDIFFSGGASTFNLLKVTSALNITISSNLTITGLVAAGDPSLFLFADSDANGSGTLKVDSDAIVATTTLGAFIQIRAADLDIDDGFLEVPTGYGGIGVNLSQEGKNIGIGTAIGDMTISNAELSRMTGVQFDVSREGGSHTTTIAGVTAAATENIGGLFALYGGPVTFMGTESIFNNSLYSTEAITLDANLTVGDLEFYGDVFVGGERTIVSTNDVIFNSAVDAKDDGGGHSLAVITGDEVKFAAAVGGAQPLDNFTVTAANIRLQDGAMTTGSQTYIDTSLATVFLNGIFTSTGGNFTIAGTTQLTGNTEIYVSDGLVTMGPVTRDDSPGDRNLTIFSANSPVLGPLGTAVNALGNVVLESFGNDIGSASPLFVNAASLAIGSEVSVASATLDGAGKIGGAAISQANVDFNNDGTGSSPSLTITGVSPPPPPPTFSGLLLGADIVNYFFSTTASGLVTIRVTETVIDDSGFDPEINLFRDDGSLDLADFIANDD